MKKHEINWPEAIKPLIKKYKNTSHPLEAKNLYQMLVMVVLSAQTTDNIVNGLAPDLFKAYPNMQSLSNASVETLITIHSKVRGFRKKGRMVNWYCKRS